MTPEVQWVWSAGSLTAWAGLVLFVAYAGISLYHLVQVQFAPYRILTEGVKFLGAILLLVVALRPEVHTRSVMEEQARLAVVLDQTDSMQTRDVEGPDGLISRLDALQTLQDSAAWTALEDQVVLDVISLGHTEDALIRETDLGAGIRLAREVEDLAGVLVLSDGDHNAAASPLLEGLQLSEADVPLFGIEVGSRKRLPDLALVSAGFPTYSILNESLVVPFTVRNAFTEATPVRAELVADGRVVAEQDLEVKAGKTVDSSLRWTPTNEGAVNLSVRLRPHPEESLLENNEQRSVVEIRRTEIRVLVIDSLPRWEVRFLRNALSRDPGVVVDTLFFHPDLEPQTAPGLLASFPQDREEWSSYDVVFLGDVGVGEGELSDQDLTHLASLVREQGSGLVFLPGPRGGQHRLSGTALEGLLPVEYAPALKQGIGSDVPMQMTLTREGREHMLTQLASSTSRSRQIWGRLPGFHWFAGVSRARVGSEVLATHRSRRNEHGRIPLLVTRDAGNGHVLFMGSDGAWRWRRGVEDLYHYRFWGQVVRWMAHKRNMMGDDGIRIFFQPERPQAGQEVTLTLSLRGGITGGSEVPFQLRLRHELGQVISPAVEELEGGGTFQARWQPELPGEVTLEVWQPEGRGQEPWFETRVLVEGLELEQRGEPADPESLRELARVTGGEAVQLEDAASLLERLRRLPEERRRLSILRLWQHPLLVVLLFTFFGLYWILRKRQGWI